MDYIKRILFVSLFLTPVMLFAQTFVLSNSLPVTNLTDTTNFTLLNARMGSRFSFSLFNEKQQIQTGSLGFDMDEQVSLLIAIEYNKKQYCFRTASLPRNYKYLNDQKLKFGPSSMEISGKTDEGIQLKFILLSSFTSSKNLEDSNAIKTQIFPGYYLLTEVTNHSVSTEEVRVKIALGKTPVKAFNYLGLDPPNTTNIDQKIYFRDNADFNLKTVLAACGTKADGIYNENGFGGLRYSFKMQPKEKREICQIYAAYNGGNVIYDQSVNQKLRFFYTKYWNNVDDVLKYAKENIENNIRQTQKFEDSLMNSSLDPLQKWALALTFHSDIANAFFLLDENINPRFYLAEGRFEHLSTVDVAHETELMAIFCPWRLKLQLEQWTHYIARNETTVKANPIQNKGVYQQGMTASEFGPFLYHDVGDLPFVSKTANYDYGPHMAVEENTSFVLLLYWYWKISKDDPFVQSKLGTVEELLQAVINRDTNENGIVDIAYGWTTYDTNEALKLSPENTYLGVKQLAAYVVAAEMFKELAIKSKKLAVEVNTLTGIVDGEGTGYNKAAVGLNNEPLRKKQSTKYLLQANIILNTLQTAANKYGYIPLSLDEQFPKWNQRTVMLGEGLFLPGLANCQSEILQKLSKLISKDYTETYQKSITPYGIKLSTDEEPTWFSKTVVADVVASKWFNIHHSSAAYIYNLNKNNPFAYNDGWLNNNKNWTGYWYPRGIATLSYWLLINNK
jgi:Glycosyl hydrolase family 52/Glycosyl-hydrolase family 116, catalytic region